MSKFVKRPRLGTDPVAPPEDDAEEAGEVAQEGNCVYFYGEVSRRNVLQLVRCFARANEYALRHCHSVQDCTVYLYVHSTGGDVYSGLSAFDHIRTNAVPVTTVLDGFAASAATFLLLAGKYRVAMSHGTILIHQLSTGFWGRYSDLKDEMHNSKSLMQTIKSIYSEHTLLERKMIERLLSEEKTMDAAKSLSMGFVHELW